MTRISSQNVGKLYTKPKLSTKDLHCLYSTSTVCDSKVHYAMNKVFYYSRICVSIIILNYSCVSVRPSVTEGQRKRLDLETQDAVSLAVELQKLETSSLH